ncbi:MAG: IS1634 family transposase [Acidobacteriota bacterium]
MWQKYLGKLQDLAKAAEGGPDPAYAEVFEFGLPSALWMESRRQRVMEIIDQLCPKRSQGLSVGEYMTLAAVNRAVQPVSKKGMWEWFAGTSLRRFLPQVEEGMLLSQRFWDHMDSVSVKQAGQAWAEIIAGVVSRAGVDLSRISYDGTNFYTFISTFNSRSSLAARGKNKQGRGNLRQISYAVFCSREGLPLFYDTYEGNRADAREFPLMVERFHEFFNALSGVRERPGITVIFDKGNNSRANIELLDRLELDFIGSLKIGEHRELTLVSNQDARWKECGKPDLEGVRTFSVEQTLYGKARRLVVAFIPDLHATQRKTLENDMDKALRRLEALSGRLEGHARGEIRGGRPPSEESIRRQCARILSRPFLQDILAVEVTPGPRLQYAASDKKLGQISDTWLGKKILVTNPKTWSDEEIVEAYHGQFVVEHLFREMKSRERPNWWPLHHWTDHKIRIHAFYCTVAMLLRALVHRRVRLADIGISIGRLFKELDNLREVVNVYPAVRRKKERRKTVLTKSSELQQRLMQILGLSDQSI